jgi:hypothetical protein
MQKYLGMEEARPGSTLGVHTSTDGVDVWTECYTRNYFRRHGYRTYNISLLYP